MPVLHLIAGPNGAGKSTLYRYLVQPRYPQLPFINADVHERLLLGACRTWGVEQRKSAPARTVFAGFAGS